MINMTILKGLGNDMPADVTRSGVTNEQLVIVIVASILFLIGVVLWVG